MDPITLSALIAAGTTLASGVGSGIAAGKRAKYQGEQSAIAEQGKAMQEEFSEQQEKESSALSSLIQAYRESLMG
jgi:hypothetical protein